MSCLSEEEHKISVANKTVKVESNLQKAHTAILTKVVENIKATVINDREIRLLSDIYQYYVAIFNELQTQAEEDLGEPVFKPQQLLNKLLKMFPILTKTVHKNRTYMHLSELPIEDVQAGIIELSENSISRIKKVAFEIRKIVMDMEKRNLPKRNLTVKDVIEGECEIPNELRVFMECLIKGPRGINKTTKDNKILSICSSIIYTMSNGSIKPSSCINLGLITKSLTGSRRMIEILNRMGFCINYTLVEGIETELAHGCKKTNRILPYGLIPNNPNLRTHVAFDNFDKFVDTKTGTDTLHDTVGIVYQNVSEGCMDVAAYDSIVVMDGDDIDGMVFQRRRKYYSQFDSSLDSYTALSQKPRTILYGKEPIFSDTLQKAIDLDHLWMFGYAYNMSDPKRWFAWHSERIVDANPIHNIGYLPSINASPTLDTVVQKTLQVAQEIAKECGQTYC